MLTKMFRLFKGMAKTTTMNSDISATNIDKLFYFHFIHFDNELILFSDPQVKDGWVESSSFVWLWEEVFCDFLSGLDVETEKEKDAVKLIKTPSKRLVHIIFYLFVFIKSLCLHFVLS